MWRVLHLRDQFEADDKIGADQQQRKIFGISLSGSPEGMLVLRNTARQLLQALDHLHS
jgi:hypothetical protein